MCIVFFRSHHDGPREHCMGAYHCAHTGCPGIFEAHHKFLLEETHLDCAECLALDGDEIDPEVRYYSPIPHRELEYVDGRVQVKVVDEEDANGAEVRSGEGNEEDATAGGQNEEEQDRDDEDEDEDYHSFRSLSDIDSITSHWRLDPIIPRRACRPAAAPKENPPATPHQQPTAVEEEPFETREAFDPHEMPQVDEPYPSNPAANQDPNIPDLPDSVFSNSPNTLEHRHLVNQQLATLTQRMTNLPRLNHQTRRVMLCSQRLAHVHQRHDSRPGFNVGCPQQDIDTFPPLRTPVTPGLSGPLRQQEQPEELRYIYPAVPQSGPAPTWRWGPAPPPYLRAMYPPF